MLIRLLFMLATTITACLIGMEDSLPGDLPKDLWIHIFNNYAPSLRTQLNLSQASKALKKIYDDKRVYYDGGVTVSFRDNTYNTAGSSSYITISQKIRGSIGFMDNKMEKPLSLFKESFSNF